LRDGVGPRDGRLVDRWHRAARRGRQGPRHDRDVRGPRRSAHALLVPLGAKGRRALEAPRRRSGRRMSKQALVVGLGQFGLALSRALAAKGVEVLAVDRREETVRAAAAFVAEAVMLDATDEVALARTLPERRDLCVCAIGDESRESSI